MDDWLFLGLLAAVAYALSAVASKLALNDKYLGVDPSVAGLYTSFGVFLVFLVYYLHSRGLAIPETDTAQALASICVGLFWALGLTMVYLALTKKADISRMAPIYNMNTLIVVLLGIFLLKELPEKSAAARVFIGAVLIILGGILVSG